MTLALPLAVCLGVRLFVSISFSGVSLLVCQTVSLALFLTVSLVLWLMSSLPVLLALPLAVCLLVSG